MSKLWLIFILCISCQQDSEKKTIDNSLYQLQLFDNGSTFIHKDSLYQVIGIGDGDTFDVLVNKTIVRIRLDGIDAPERGMPFYKVSKKYLSDLIFRKHVKIMAIKSDQNKRLVAKSLVDSTDVSAQMLKAGLAWHYKKYNTSKQYAQFEMTAKSKKQGLWHDSKSLPPWEIRKIRRSGQSTKELFE